jgi:hypothetical protein
VDEKERVGFGRMKTGFWIRVDAKATQKRRGEENVYDG